MLGWLGKLFSKEAEVAYSTWHASKGADTCKACRDLDGTCWTPESGERGPPLREGCTCPGGCRCRALVVRMDEAWGPGNAAWIRKQGGRVSGERMERFLSG